MEQYLLDPSFSPKHYQKEHKTWKGKMVQTLRRYGSGATPPDSTSSEEYTGALGVPLEHCVSSFANEVIGNNINLKVDLRCKRPLCVKIV